MDEIVTQKDEEATGQRSRRDQRLERDLGRRMRRREGGRGREREALEQDRTAITSWRLCDCILQQGAGRSLEQRWRDFFAAQDLWHAIQYDTYNGTYPQLYHLMPDERPGNPERMRELQMRESLGIISNAEVRNMIHTRYEWRTSRLCCEARWGCVASMVMG